MMSFRSIAIATATSFVLAFTAQAAPVIMKFSHVVSPVGSPKGEAAAAFAERVNREMAGKVDVQVFPNSQLFNDDEVLAAILLGDVQLAAPSLSKFESYTLKFRLFDLPFLFNDIAAVDRFQNGPEGQALLLALKDKGLLGLTYWHNGLKQMSAGKPLMLPGDVKGLKFRIQQSDVLQAQFEVLGANPQKMVFAEVYGALQTGTVDGQENTWSNIYTQKFYEVQEGITETNHGLLDYLVVTSAPFWERLDPQIRKDVKGILDSVTVEYNRKANEINAVRRDEIVAGGFTVRELSPAQRSAWVSAVRPVWKMFEEDIGEDLIKAALSTNEAK